MKLRGSFMCLLMLFFGNSAIPQTELLEQRNGMVMRLIGHELLLKSGDSTSRVLPVNKVNGRYVVSFENDFELNTDDLVFIVDSVMLKTKLAEEYTVEVQKCNTDSIVHSYGVLKSYDDIFPCGGRAHSKDCYELHITLIGQKLELNTVESKTDYGSFIVFGIAGLILSIACIVFWKRKDQSNPNEYVIDIGKYKFDQRTSILKIGDNQVELTGKEGDLLVLLHGSSNKTLEREFILNKVWGDEGDYVGRTLDVFISKLRKKLEEDPNIKISNIRGVGYKFILSI